MNGTTMWLILRHKVVYCFKNTVLSEESEVKSDTIRGHRLNNIYNPIFELTLTPEQIDMIDEVCKPFIIQNHKPILTHPTTIQSAVIMTASVDLRVGLRNTKSNYLN